jgi:hypothetical protein
MQPDARRFTHAGRHCCISTCCCIHSCRCRDQQSPTTLQLGSSGMQFRHAMLLSGCDVMLLSGCDVPATHTFSHMSGVSRSASTDPACRTSRHSGHVVSFRALTSSMVSSPSCSRSCSFSASCSTSRSTSSDAPVRTAAPPKPQRAACALSASSSSRPGPLARACVGWQNVLHTAWHRHAMLLRKLATAGCQHADQFVKRVRSRWSV